MVLKYTTFLFNIDGFLWDWKRIDSEFITVFEHIIEHGRRIVLLTNNSAYSKLHLTRKLQEKGLKDLDENNIFTSIDSLIYYLYKMNISSVYVIGEYGLIKELESEGIGIDIKAENVVLGIDRNLTYNKLKEAYDILKGGGKLLHLDNALLWRIGEHIFPITLPLISYFETALGGNLNKLFLGKPSVVFKEALLNRYKFYSSSALLVSNNINDMRLASMLGIDSMLVHPEHNKLIKKLSPEEKPKHVASNIAFVKELL